MRRGTQRKTTRAVDKASDELDDPTIAEDIETPVDASVDDRGWRARDVAPGIAGRKVAGRKSGRAGARADGAGSALQEEAAHFGTSAITNAGRDPTAMIIVADSVRARFYVASDVAAAPLREVASLLNPEGRSHERDLVSDAAGRRGHQPTRSGASAFGGESAKAHRGEEFAARVCEFAVETLNRCPGTRIHIVAESQFLGLLRQRMNPRMQGQVASEVPKSFVGRRPTEIRTILPARL